MGSRADQEDPLLMKLDAAAIKFESPTV